jgi:predicted nuclease of predicted toxin-antitoxin system
MKILIDMNLSPLWVDFFASVEIHAVHWSAIGNAGAPDTALMSWAVANNHIVFTHDLDFGALLAITQAQAPSVVQVRTQDTFFEVIGEIVVSALKQFEAELDSGALVTIDASRSRVRILPFDFG